ncbi:syntaxin-22-like [Hordeum vulgare subsp. vulgare]|uniref:t-SNARE coiled-coil homology domain-containing protein n=1 Tax=Hordeum vulgare subsp. vulgare TaxID=112509 RepID=A0A8I7BHA5_HORVV|nr:syntaxin-22-like [Hordeum vulgare subsp. vulgare]
MSFADLESGALQAPRRGRGADATRALVFQITTAVSSYRRLLNSLGTPKDTPTLRDQLQKTSHKVLQLAKDAKEKLTSTAEADKSTGTSADKRVADMKLAKDFAATMEEFRKLQNLAIQREMAYKPVVTQSAQPSYTTNDGRSDSDKMPEQRALLAEPNRLEVLQLDNEIVFNEAIIEEREQAILDIQQQIGEVHEAFKDLATLVHAQGGVIEEIDTNIDNSAAATNEAKKEIGKASKTQKSNSSLLCLLMVIFGVVLLIVIIVLAS